MMLKRKLLLRVSGRRSVMGVAFVDSPRCCSRNNVSVYRVCTGPLPLCRPEMGGSKKGAPYVHVVGAGKVGVRLLHEAVHKVCLQQGPVQRSVEEGEEGS